MVIQPLPTWKEPLASQERPPGASPFPAADKTRSRSSRVLPGRVSAQGPRKDERDFPADLLTPHYLHLQSRTQTDIFPMLRGSVPALHSGPEQCQECTWEQARLCRAEGEEESWAPPTPGPSTASKTIIATFQRGFSPANALQKGTCTARVGWGCVGTLSLGYIYILCPLSQVMPAPGVGHWAGSGVPSMVRELAWVQGLPQHGVQMHLLSLLSTAPFWGGISPSPPSSPPGTPWPSPCLNLPGLNQGGQPVPSTQRLEAEPGFLQHVPVSLPPQRVGSCSIPWPSWGLHFHQAMIPSWLLYQK